MTDQTLPQPSTELRRINWSACFPFTAVFRTFRIAIQPSKLGLAMVAVLLTSLWGHVLDGLWSSKCLPPAGEVNAFWQQADIKAWRENVKASWPEAAREAYGMIKVKPPEKLADRLASDPHDTFDTLLDRISKEHHTAIEATREQVEKDASAKGNVDAEVARRAQDFVKACQKVEAVAPRGVYVSFVEYQRTVSRQLVRAATTLNFAEGLPDVLTSRTAPPPQLGPMEAFKGGAAIPALAAALGSPGLDEMTRLQNEVKGLGVLPCVVLALRGFQWMAWEHFWFAVLFWLPVLVIWGLVGGAICRMAAMNVARDEQPSPGTALRFAQRKLVSLAVAPLFPIGFVLLIGVVLFLGGLFMAIPGLGEIVGGLGMVLGLAAGLLMAAVLIGGLAGAPLMWPTIAVEGSDAFDAFSRGYSYVFNRPWRAALYAGALTVYGAICYLFVRFFVLVGLKAARLFIGVGLAGTSRPATGNAEATKIDVLWPAPTWDQLLPDPLPLGTQALDSWGAFLIGMWLIVVIALLCAFAASFFLSGSTIIYYLLRRDVDSTDLEEVYIESDEEEDRSLELPGGPGEPGTVSAPSSGSGAQEAPPGPGPTEPAKEDPAGPGDRSIDAE